MAGSQSFHGWLDQASKPPALLLLLLLLFNVVVAADVRQWAARSMMKTAKARQGKRPERRERDRERRREEGKPTASA